MADIAFLGLGIIGAPMAGHMLHAGHQVTVWNRTPAKGIAWKQAYPSGALAEDASTAVREADFIFMCLGNDQSIADIVFGADGGIIDHIKPNAVLVDHTTASAEMAQRLFHTLNARNIGFVDAPVSGGQIGAQKGTLTIMCGGEPEVFQTVESIMQAYASQVTLIGQAGSGQLCKMVNQICIAGIIQSLSEAITFALKENLDIDKVFSTISKGAAASWQMDNRHKWMAESDFQDNKGFPIEWMIKDLGMCLDQAKKNGLELPVTKLIQSYYQELRDQGKGRLDTAALIERLK